LTHALIVRIGLAWLHLLALGVGLGGVWGRARALHDSLREPADPRAIGRALVADVWWGIAAAVWIATGLWRLIGGTEKPTAYYLANHAFYAKMGMLLAILALEVWPMVTLMRWRSGKAEPHARDVGRIEVISYVECALVVTMVVAAVATARGLGITTGSTAMPTTSSDDSLTALGDSAEVSPVAQASPPQRVAAGEVASAAGTPVSPSSADLDLLASELSMPLAGIDPSTLHSSFNDLRGTNRRHEALDIMARRRTSVLSAAPGRVLKLFTSKAGGLMVYAADSAERFILMYAHLDGYARGVREGTPLKRDQLIGYVGSTGNASPAAPHLHFALARSANVAQWWRGTPVDPLPLLQRAQSKPR
jgi:peptidoglycan LD-endopeptidase LytH